jgi:hypothetical protein
MALTLLINCVVLYYTINSIMAAAPVAFNAALIRIGFSQDAVASINQNQVKVSENLIGMSKDDVEQLMKIIRGGHGVPVITVPFMAQKKFALFCY